MSEFIKIFKCQCCGEIFEDEIFTRTDLDRPSTALSFLGNRALSAIHECDPYTAGLAQVVGVRKVTLDETTDEQREEFRLRLMAIANAAHERANAILDETNQKLENCTGIGASGSEESLKYVADTVSRLFGDNLNTRLVSRQDNAKGV